MNVENCSNCDRVIGKLERAYVSGGNVVCLDCYRKLSNTGDKQGKAAIKKPIVVVIALLVLAVSLFYLVNYNQKKNQLSEKDVKLIEAFIHEMNLLDEVKFTGDERAYEAQRVKLEAARDDLSNLGSNSNSMVRMRGLAWDVWLKYETARLARDSFNASHAVDEWNKSEKDASQSRDNFVKAFRVLQGLESEQKNEATSK